MRRIDVPSPGVQPVLREWPDPVPGPGEVLVAVRAAGVNRADLLQLAGRYPPPPGAPDWPGLEISGRVVDVGAGVTWPRPGDEVVALLDGGGWADLALARAGDVLPVPPGVGPVEAAALPEAAATVWSTLTAARLTAGETVLVHGGSGGVGSLAVQIAVAAGARVLATAGGAARVARCLDLGADVAVDHRGDVTADVLSATGGRGVDVILDVVGAAGLAANLGLLADGGRLAVIGLQGGRRAELDLGLLLARRATVLGTTLRSRRPAEKAAIMTAVGEHVWPMVAAGRVRPVIHEVLPLAQAGSALDHLAAGEAFGKILLAP